MKTLAIIISLIFFEANAQSFSTIPQGSSSSAGQARPTGNTLPTRGCEGHDPGYLKIAIRPSCYGANLRNEGGKHLDPRGGPIGMNVRLENQGKTLELVLDLPVKSAWADTYGSICSYRGPGIEYDCDVNDPQFVYTMMGQPKCRTTGHTVTCPIAGQSVAYSCDRTDSNICPLIKYKNCRRQGDPARQGNLNKTLQCRQRCTWHGSVRGGPGAARAYRIIAGSVSCGVRQVGENYASQVSVTGRINGVTRGDIAGSIDKHAERGLVTVTLQNISSDFKKMTPIRDTSRGTWRVSGNRSVVRTPTFAQDGQALGVKEPIPHGLDNFEQCLTIEPVFLGSERFCGSYYSPLMLFFGKKRPRYDGRSSFPLHPENAITHWVEKGAPGFFLALDKNGNNMIDSTLELFGDNEQYENGFESLKAHDQNGDFKIDSRDSVFGKLLLWKDKNGDGISQKRELETLADRGVSSIGLYYKKGSKNYGRRALLKEKGSFSFTWKDRRYSGSVEDIWFSPVE